MVMPEIFNAPFAFGITQGEALIIILVGILIKDAIMEIVEKLGECLKNNKQK